MSEVAHFDREVTGKAVEVAAGFWVVATRHHPGLSKQMMEINNRVLVFRLDDRDGPVLMAVNQPDPSAIPEVQRLERETGLQVRYLVSPGSGHHLNIEPWHAAFPAADVWIEGQRIPRTAHGRKLVAMPRVKTTADPDHPFPQFEGQLEAVQFRGIDGLHDSPTPAEGAKDNLVWMLKAMLAMTNISDPHDELWLCHVATGTVIGGENLGWMYPADKLRSEGFMLRQMIQPDRVWLNTQARKVRDPALVAACWSRVLSWPCRTLITFHDSVGYAFQDDPGPKLRAAAVAAKQLPA
jgi:hypothetical protein